MSVTLSEFARNVTVETAFNVLAKAKELAAGGKAIVELEIGDSPFATTAAAKEAGLAAIGGDQTHYCPSAGLPELRRAASEFVNAEYGLTTTAANIVVGPGAKVFELLFCETFLDPGDGVLVFSPYFPTYVPNIARRGARVWLSDLKQEREFRPNLKIALGCGSSPTTRTPRRSSSTAPTTRPAAWPRRRTSKGWPT